MKYISIYLISVVLGLVTSVAWAGSVTIPNTFSSGAKAKADEVNANFSAVKTAIDDNAGNVAYNKKNISANTSSLSANVTAINGNAGQIVKNMGEISSNTSDIGNHEIRITNIENKLSTQHTGYITIPVFSFSPVDSSTTIYGKTDNPFIISITGGLLEMAAKINVPEGVTITGLSIRAWDSSATNFVTVELRKYTGSASPTLVTSVGTTDVEASGYYTKEDNSLSETVSYSGANLPYYYLVYKVNAVADNTGPTIYAARITYTY